MTFDTPGLNTGSLIGGGARQHLETEECGAGVDWSRGLKGLKNLRANSNNEPGAVLTKVIEGEIIPRLFLAHSLVEQERRAGIQVEDLSGLASCEAFARLVLVSEPAEIVDRIERFLDRGIKLERIFLDMLAPVARKLGEFWEEDRCTFADVTLGLARLHQVLHEIGRRKMCNFDGPAQKHRAFFVPVPGEQHTFGLSMLEEFFLHAGWETASDHTATMSAILRTVTEQSVDVIGISVGCKEFLDPLSDLIAKVRGASKNRDALVMLGGRVFLESPELSEKFEAATTVTDGVHAVHTAERLVSRPTVAEGSRKTV
jgi:methanogenic corrinoid protein MtbC1